MQVCSLKDLKTYNFVHNTEHRYWKQKPKNKNLIKKKKEMKATQN